MGLIIKKNKKGKYILKSSISNESLHPDEKTISEIEAKKILINRAYLKFLDEIIEIDMTFPNGYYVNDKYYMDRTKTSFNEWRLSLYKLDDNESDKIYKEKVKEIINNLDIDLSLD